MATLLTIGSNLGELRAAEELKRELQAGWQQLQALDEQRKTYDVIRDETDSQPGRTARRLVSRVRVRVDWSNGYRLMEKNAEKGVLIYARNPDYTFAILKESDSQDWRLQGQNKASSERNPLDQTALIDRSLLYPLSTSFCDTSLPDLLQDANFQIISSRPAPSGKTSIQFRHKRWVPALKKWIAYEGDMLVNPNLSWIVEEWNFGGAGGARSTKVSRVVERDPQGILLCRSVTYGNPVQKRVMTFENHDFSPFSLEPFRMSHYGLSEPVDVPPPPRSMPRYLWLVLGGIGLAGLAWLCRKLAKGYFANSGSASKAPLSPKAE